MIGSIVFEQTELALFPNHMVNLPFAIAVPDGASFFERLWAGKFESASNAKSKVEAILRDK
jgi:hypothetical protein